MFIDEITSYYDADNHCVPIDPKFGYWLESKELRGLEFHRYSTSKEDSIWIVFDGEFANEVDPYDDYQYDNSYVD